MTNRELEEKLRRAAGKITPDVMDSVYKRIDEYKDSEAIVPMDLSARKRRRVSVWIPVLASAAALLLVLNVGMFVYYHGSGKGEAVSLDPAAQTGVTEGGALLIERIVQIDPEYTPEELSAYSIDQLDTILLVAKNRQESKQEAAAVETSGTVEGEITPVEEIVDPAPAEDNTGDALIATVGPEEGIVSVSQDTASENLVSPEPIDDDPQPSRGDEEIYAEMGLTDESAYAAVLKDAGVAKEEVISHSISSVVHTTYGVLFTIDFSTDRFIYHYRITKDGTLLAAGRELIVSEDETENNKEVR